MSFMAQSSVLSPNELAKVLELIMDKMAKENPKMALDQSSKEQLASELATSLIKEKGEIKRSALENSDAINRLYIATNLAVSLKKEEKTLDKLSGLFRDKLEQTLSPEEKLKLKFFNELDPKEQKSFREELQKKMDNIFKNLSPAEKKLFEAEGQKLAKALEDGLKDSKLAKPKPSKGKKEVSMIEEDVMANLLGMINHHMTGSIPVVVQCCMGNGRGFPDVNPYHGMAQIDEPYRPDAQDVYGFHEAYQTNKKSIFDSVGEFTYAAAKSMRPEPK